MKTIAEYEVKLPDYSLSYLINCDSSGIDSEDIKKIDDFMAQFYNEADLVNGSVVISPNDEESYFTGHPAFGLPCNVVDSTILILA